MRSLALAFALAFLLLAIGPMAASAAQLTITVDGIRNAKGDIRLSVYASPAEWPDHASADHDQVLPAKTSRVVFTFDLPPGIYAVNGFHDEIGNGKFKTSLIGLPEEGYLFSNNVRPVLSAPSFKSASFKLPPEGAAISISVQYP
jgi:uncharacterized protein (DUF2141 family)